MGKDKQIVFLLTYLTYASLYFIRKPFSLLKLEMIKDLGYSTQDVGFIDSGFLIAYAIGQFVLGPVGDKHGAKKFLVVGYLCASLATLLFSLSSNFHGYLLFWTINGFCQAGAFPMMVKALQPWFSSLEFARAYGYWSSCQQVGGIASIAFTSLLLSFFHWKRAMSILAIIVIFSSIILLALPTRPTATVPHQVPSRNLKIFQVMQIPGLKNLGFSYFCVKLIRYTIMSWIPVYLSTQLGYSLAVSGTLSTVFDMGGVASAMIAGVIIDKKLRSKSMLLLLPYLLLCSITLSWYYSIKHVVLNGIFLFVIGFFVSVPDSMLGGNCTSTLCQKNDSGDSIGTAAGIVNGFGSVGSILQGSLTAVLVEMYGWNVLFMILACLSVFGGLMLVPLAMAEGREFSQEGKRD